VACNGVHGANRLASLSLLDGLVFGKRCGDTISKKLTSNSHYRFPKIAPWKYENESAPQALMMQDKLMIKHTMWNYAGLVRTTKQLKRAESLLIEMNVEIERFYKHAILSDELIGLRNMSLVSKLIVKAAILNTESSGCHFISD